MISKMDLTPIYGNQKSFYGKAKVLSAKNEQTLTSYGTFICTIAQDSEGKTLTMACTEYELTMTTLKHLKEFMLQNGFPALTKKQVVGLIRNNDNVRLWFNA